MIAEDEHALICDLAETYQIYDYRSLPLSRVAIFAVGLRENSRIKMKMSERRYPLDTLLMAGIMDRLSLLVWQQTRGAQYGSNKPDSVLAKLLDMESGTDMEIFDSASEFEKRRNEIMVGGA